MSSDCSRVSRRPWREEFDKDTNVGVYCNIKAFMEMVRSMAKSVFVDRRGVLVEFETIVHARGKKKTTKIQAR